MASQGDKHEATVEVLREIAKKHGFRMRPQDEPEYLAIVRGVQRSIDWVDSRPDYIHPQFLSDVDILDRKYARPSPSDNPLNAWSHRTHIQSPTTNGTGLLAGKTVAIKDTVSVAGVPLTCGTQPFHLSKDKPYPIPEADAPVVSRILEAGAVITGTSTIENYSLSAMSFTGATGPVENPWLRGYSAGGSSSGSAALIAINVLRKWREARGLPVEDLGEGVDLAIGGDQGGSIRVPAAYCGIYGLKPTHGLVPYTGIAPLLPRIDHVGPMAASVRDTALLLTVLAGYDGFDPRMTPETPLRAAVPSYHTILDQQIAERVASGTWTPKAAARGLRIGILKEAFEIAGLSAEVASVVRKAASRFAALGASVSEVSIPLHLVAPHIFNAETRAYAVDSLLYHKDSTTASSLPYPLNGAEPPPSSFTQAWYETMTASNPLVVSAIFSGEVLQDRSRYPETVREKAIRHVHELRAAYDDALEIFDVLLTPATPTVGPPQPPAADVGVAEKAGYVLSNTPNTLPFNITGHPGFVIPVGWGRAAGVGEEKARLPVGMQIVGRRWDEQTLFLAAAAWEVGGLGLDEE
ncbi:hypothetical protein M426DRAFT_320484 [Hypoxylon sp. CI-4A]|nr:hypothetical protein M426DRAFT_320484 [Hypoxylon sp. CI-4A]